MKFQEEQAHQWYISSELKSHSEERGSRPAKFQAYSDAPLYWQRVLWTKFMRLRRRRPARRRARRGFLFEERLASQPVVRSQIALVGPIMMNLGRIAGSGWTRI